MNLSLRTKILLHLERYPQTCFGQYSAPAETTVAGIKSATGTSEGYTHVSVKKLLASQHIEYVTASPNPGGRNSHKCRCYKLTESGRQAAREIRGAIAAENALQKREEAVA